MKRFMKIGTMVLMAAASAFLTSCGDDDSSSPSAVSGSSFSAQEPTAGTVTLGFQLNEPTDKEIEVTITVSGGTATNGVDFELVEGTSKIAAGETNGSFKVKVINDIIDEADETAEFKISAAGISTTGTYVLTIIDDDCDFEFVGNLGGTDANLDKVGFVGTADVTVAFADGEYTISGLNEDWMQSFWEETVVDSDPVKFTIDGAGNITIERQYILTTLYNGNNYDYEIEGTGVLNTCDGTLTIDYEIFNEDGDGLGDISHSQNWMTDDIFKAVLSIQE